MDRLGLVGGEWKLMSGGREREGDCVFLFIVLLCAYSFLFGSKKTLHTRYI